MDKQALLKEVYESSFNAELEKIANKDMAKMNPDCKCSKCNHKKGKCSDKCPGCGHVEMKKTAAEMAYKCPKCGYEGNKPGKCPKCDAMMVKK